MIGPILTVLVILALIAAIWGRDKAQGCAAWLGGAAFLLVALVVLAAMGVTTDAIGAFLKWAWIAVVVYLVGFLVSAKAQQAREHKKLAQERECRERHAAYTKKRIDDVQATSGASQWGWGH